MNGFPLALLSTVIAFLFACKSNNLPSDEASDAVEIIPTNDSVLTDVSSSPMVFLEEDPLRLTDFVRRIFEDKDGNLWLGTNGDGLIRYDGESFLFFNESTGFDAYAVRGIVSDNSGLIWIGTESGMFSYDGRQFKKYTVDNGLKHDDIWAVRLDSKGTLWVGSYLGASYLKDDRFVDFDLPEGEYDPYRGVSSKRIVHCIREDSKGQLWFGTSAGAFCFNGKELDHFNEEKGLCSNAVNDIIEDDNGHIWFATHHQGICRYNGTSFDSFGIDHGVKGREAWSFTKDSNGDIWFPTEGYGVYRFDGQVFHQYSIEQGLRSTAVQCIYEDSNKDLWFGGYTGLYKMQGDTIIPIRNEKK